MNNVDKVFEIVELNEMTAEEVLQLFTNYYGTRIITDEFIEFIEDEGYIVD
jgi:hypothetical protein